eukprot:1498515-Amphidinium_carterae.2
MLISRQRWNLWHRKWNLRLVDFQCLLAEKTCGVLNGSAEHAYNKYNNINKKKKKKNKDIKNNNDENNTKNNQL